MNYSLSRLLKYLEIDQTDRLLIMSEPFERFDHTIH